MLETISEISCPPTTEEIDAASVASFSSKNKCKYKIVVVLHFFFLNLIILLLETNFLNFFKLTYAKK